LRNRHLECENPQGREEKQSRSLHFTVGVPSNLARQEVWRFSSCALQL
jgi:hypothetical protein